MLLYVTGPLARASSRQVRCVLVVLARWTLKNDQTYYLFDSSLTQYLLILRYDYSEIRAACVSSGSVSQKKLFQAGSLLAWSACVRQCVSYTLLIQLVDR